jgi:hypothetical protein
MLEETPDRNPAAPYARLLALAAQRQHPRSADEWVHAWHDREGYWTQRRTPGHWLQRSQTRPAR